MKRDMIKIETPDGIKLQVPAHVVASTFIAAALAQVGVVHEPAAEVATPAAQSAVPGIGEYWPGHGGLNGGFVAERNGVPAHYLIVADKDAGKYKWGGYEKDSAAKSKTDGLANTFALVSEGGHPAAQACADFKADGHSDFYLPAAAELYHCWLTCPELFDQSNWYWSSTQRSAHCSFLMDFGGGRQGHYAKSGELRVRPVRRLFI